MPIVRVEFAGQQIILHQLGSVGCATPEDLAGSTTFAEIVEIFVRHLKKRDAAILDTFPLKLNGPESTDKLVASLRALASTPLEKASMIISDLAVCLDHRQVFHRFVELLYDYWRHYSRFIVSHSDPDPDDQENRSYRAFNASVEHLNQLVRGLYRDICENITGEHPWIYRQVIAGATVGLTAVTKPTQMPESWLEKLRDIPFIRQVLLTSPMIIDPPMNKRTGSFEKIDENPLDVLELDTSKFLCFPAQVGELVIFIYFHQNFLELGTSLSNLFELATDAQIAKGPDAVYVYGAPPEMMKRYGELPTVFFDDEANQLLIAAVPLEDRFGYFGYLKKMILTLHNVVMMKRGRMPFHGAMTRITLENGAAANVIILGDTATGKSESLEALRVIGEGRIRELEIIADDMGSIDITPDGDVIGYGTEVGAFVRLDDLQQGYAFGQIDRAIIMSPQKINARAVLPVTKIRNVLKGHQIDFFLYANNYEEIDEERSLIEVFSEWKQAIDVFRRGAAMAKGTTTSKGLVHSYFANIFGAPQYRDLHEQLAVKTFQAAFAKNVIVGQMRTRLAIPGYESRGPEAAARALLEMIAQRVE